MPSKARTTTGSAGASGSAGTTRAAAASPATRSAGTRTSAARSTPASATTTRSAGSGPAAARSTAARSSANGAAGSRSSTARSSTSRSAATRSSTTRATATRSSAARPAAARSGTAAPRGSAAGTITSRGVTPRRATTRPGGAAGTTPRSGSPTERATARRADASPRGTQQAPVAEDWYRLGVLDGVAGEHEAVAASIRIPFLRLNVERPHRRRGVLTGRPAPLADTGRAGARSNGESSGSDGWRLGPVELPSPSKSAYYLGLGALAALQVVEWPVVAAIAAGTWVAQHTRPEAPAAGGAPWDLLRHLGRDQGGHGRNGSNGHAGAGADTHVQNGHAPHRASADS